MRWLRILPTLTLACLISSSVFAESATDFVDGQPKDSRLKPPKDLNGYFPFHVPDTIEAWEERAKDLRTRILVANGLWPELPKTSLNPVIHGKVERDDFTVEKVYFESIPGFYVTGLLYRPKGKGDGPFPAVLSPHGHGGRLMDVGDRINDQIEKGEEKYQSGKFAKLARCAHLARMGCVVFIYDMLGYADSQQISYDLAHRFAKQRPEMEGPENWGLFSAQAEMRMQSIMGLQTWNSIRCLDFLCGLPDVDPARLGVTGGSGGGTQTILLCAIDDRPIVAFPQGMVSTSMQGGCTCENVTLLRIGTGNVELAALFAPKPQAMTAANDWTKEMMTKGYPELKKLYTMYGVPEKVDCDAFLHFPHNYNYVTRGLMYDWFNQHLGLGAESTTEPDYELLTLEEMKVWDDEHPAPEGGDAYELKLCKQLAEISDRQLSEIAPVDQAMLGKYRKIVGTGVRTLIGRTLDDVGPIERENLTKQNKGDYWLFEDLISMTDHGEQLPVISLYPSKADWNGEVVIWATGQGKSGLFTESGEPIPEIQSLLGDGFSIVTADLFAQGEFVSEELPSDKNRVVGNPREYAGYTYTYNHTLFAQRVHDVLSLIKWVKSNELHPVDHVVLVGTHGAGPVMAAASAVAQEHVDELAVDINGFRFQNITDYRDANFLPGIVKYGDVDALLALTSPNKLLVLNGGQASKLVQQAYLAVEGASNTFSSSDYAVKEITKWLSE